MQHLALAQPAHGWDLPDWFPTISLFLAILTLVQSTVYPSFADTYKNCLEGEAHASCIRQQWLKWIVKGFSPSVHVYIYPYMSIHTYVQMFLEKAWFYGLVHSALKRLLFNYVRQQSGQKSNQVIKRAPAGPRAERSYSSEWPFGKELRKEAEGKVESPPHWVCSYLWENGWCLPGHWLRKTWLPPF